MNRLARFRPCLEALEERSLLSVSVSQYGVALVIDGGNGPSAVTISLINNGNGHITGDIIDENGGRILNGGTGFFNVDFVTIYGGPKGTAIDYYQQADQVYAPGFGCAIMFAEGQNTLNATLKPGVALRAGAVSFFVHDGQGSDSISVHASGVAIGPGAQLSVSAKASYLPTGGDSNFSMDYSGVNRGKLTVNDDAGTDGEAVMRLDATFLGAPVSRGSIPGRAPSGAGPGDLTLTGGLGDNSMEMLLFSPGDLSVTGDVYGTSHGVNSCVRTRNVHSHNCNPDIVFPVSSFRPGNQRAINPAGFLHP
jgi:hypothetical protein